MSSSDYLISSDSNLAQVFTSQTQVSLRQRIPAKQLSTLAVGGPLQYLVEPNTVEELQCAIQWMSSNFQRFLILGAGSNLLISDDGITDWVIKLGKGFRRMQAESGNDAKYIRIVVGGAMPLMTLSKEMCQQGYSGLEFAGGIPATVGGAVYMNAGAHGGEMADVIDSVTIVDPKGEILKLDRSQLAFSYRKSNIPNGAVVVSVELSLLYANKEVALLKREECLRERKSRQPLSAPSVGSVFKNPSPQEIQRLRGYVDLVSGPISAGRLIELCNLKGTKIGGAELSKLHANWIINPEKNASSNDVNSLIRLCQDKVSEKFGVLLETEVVRWETL